MKVVFFVHAVASCWNNGNAHFLRGVVTALQEKGHEVVLHEPAGAWSRENLIADHGVAALERYARTFPHIQPALYAGDPDLIELTEGADLVIVHEWNEPDLVNRLGRMRANGAPFVLLFHDTHHRAATVPDEMARFDLSGYDGVLAFGAAIGEIYEERGWARRVWTWHEAADTSIFYPRQAGEIAGDLVWVGNWGDEERSDELREFLLEPSSALALTTHIYGVRYPQYARDELKQHGIEYRGFLPNYDAPDAFARHRFTVHVPRRPYARALPGIPTIRVFEALACGIPLISAPWEDTEQLFPAGSYLRVNSGEEMRRAMRAVLDDEDLAASLRETGLKAVLNGHTCRDRVDQLLEIYSTLAPRTGAQRMQEAV
ncbi:Spore maturation protein CgeB [Faunimonas pinastri]|uniref:Spore maturation protein CgeB n=1 Tax=Faunimonas pinastri TaxID=1855383 RepID=A0A1H9JXL1_9HYPH|nr:glycosyltransferase [Faunimonas pinastri]SEQ91558.1 Spore maturation protein CgeB [Faunimonas pinastri]